MLTAREIGITVIEAVVCPTAFWRFTGAAFRQSHEQSDEESGDEAKNGLRDALFTRPAARVSWLSSFVLLFYVGVEVTVGGWIVTIMMEVRHAAPFPSGMTATGFWLGITAGRVVLGVCVDCMVGSQFLCLCGGGVYPGFLPRSTISLRGRCHNQASAQASSCGSGWLRGCIWRCWCSSPPICGRRNCTGYRS
ncbi:unnamed protein product [Aspergillus oryzae RIB40]|uniref:DNA, SC012 n=1 Tax=Aspergillus oryzae (strain ATCC 42149 / RIB 40) TaxID=510516 RepID=Q2UD20_ASPOR|nr:unnamed protein product [Aspergillus oryzae RIB40]BAE60545.1 unnamed protein product [Aspergillus oryzae RIB40]